MDYYKFKIRGNDVLSITEGVCKTDKNYTVQELDSLLFDQWLNLYGDNYEDDEIEPEYDAYIEKITEEEFNESGLFIYDLEDLW